MSVRRTRRITALIGWNHDIHGFEGSIPGFPGIVEQAPSAGELLRRLQEAVEDWLVLLAVEPPPVRVEVVPVRVES
jgi:predicted RNase H-like HicB family nuclease